MMMTKPQNEECILQCHAGILGEIKS